MNDDQAQRDRQTVSPAGESLAQLPDGVILRDIPIQIDDRGSVRELFDLRWNWCPEPVQFVYSFSIRPGMIKGWGLHKLHQDRYYVLSGEVEVVLYDERPASPTHGLISKIVLSEYRGRVMNIPAGIWHADRNLGTKDALVVNFPTIPYDHANPDKYRLPLTTDRIPYKFDNPRGY